MIRLRFAFDAEERACRLGTNAANVREECQRKPPPFCADIRPTRCSQNRSCIHQLLCRAQHKLGGTTRSFLNPRLAAFSSVSLDSIYPARQLQYTGGCCVAHYAPHSKRSLVQWSFHASRCSVPSLFNYLPTGTYVSCGTSFSLLKSWIFSLRYDVCRTLGCCVWCQQLRRRTTIR